MSVEKPICPYTRGEYLWACSNMITFMGTVLMLTCAKLGAERLSFILNPAEQQARLLPVPAASLQPKPTFDLHGDGRGGQKESPYEALYHYLS